MKPLPAYFVLPTLVVVIYVYHPAVGLQPSTRGELNSLWQVYHDVLSTAKYIDLTHTLKPRSPIWYGFSSPQQFKPARNPKTNSSYTYAKDGFEATEYTLHTDQYGTQLDPPAHWDPYYPAIDELPATYAVRPLVVISIAEQVEQNPGYQLQVSDIHRWELQHGRIPAGCVVMIRSDWYKKRNQPDFTTLYPFPGVGLDALKFLHLQRGVLFHGHEPLDTDNTPTLEGEDWLLHNGYAQAEGVRNLDMVMPVGCLVSVGFPKLAGGTGGYARYVAICPSSWPHGVTVEETAGPLPRSDEPLQWDEQLGYRVRKPAGQAVDRS